MTQSLVGNELVENARAALQDASRALSEALHSLDHYSETVGIAASSATGGAIDPFVFRLSIFVLAIFVGYYVVWQVTPALHTPLMSVTNAISSVIIVGALLAAGVDTFSSTDPGAKSAQVFGFFALLLAAINIAGGFLVTQRMLAMYRKNK